MRFSLRPLVPLCTGLLILAGCGGGGGAAAPSPEPPTNPTTTTMAAVAGSSAHVTLTWQGGSAGTPWRLERRAGETGAYEAVAEVDSGAGLWMDAGLGADTAYSYRLSRADGSVAATASVRTGSEAALVTDAPQGAGETAPLPYTPDTRSVSTADGSLQLALPAGAFSQAGSAVLQPVDNPLPDGVGTGFALSLPERPARPLSVSLRYGADESAEDVSQDRIAARRADGSWWLLPLLALDEAQRRLRVELPTTLWPAGGTAAALRAGPAATAAAVKVYLVRVKAHKLVPAAATVRVLGSQRFVPVSIYVTSQGTDCSDTATGDLCVPMPVVRDVTLPVLNTKPGYQRQWTLEGSATPDASLGTLNVQPQAGVIYTAPAQVPATNPLMLRFTSTHVASGRRLVLKAPVRVAEDAWVGQLEANVGDLDAGHTYRMTTRWSLDAAQSTPARRVYRPSGDARHLYTMLDPVCTHAVAPTQLTLAQAGATGELVVDESVQPARYALTLNTRWDSVLTVQCPRGTVNAPTVGGHLWDAQGVVAGGRIEGSDSGLGRRSWSLGRPQ